MEKVTGKTSFGQWFSPINLQLFEEQVKTLRLVFIALIVYCLHVLAQIETKSKRKTLQISRYLRAALWKPAHIWLRKNVGKGVP